MIDEPLAFAVNKEEALVWDAATVGAGSCEVKQKQTIRTLKTWTFHPKQR
jgi:hypothetical protein